MSDASKISKLLLREVVRLHGIPRTIVLDQDQKFIGHFQRTLWERLETKLNFSTSYHQQKNGQTKEINMSLSTIDTSQIHKKMTKDANYEGSSQQAKEDLINRRNGQGSEHLKFFLLVFLNI